VSTVAKRLSPKRGDVGVDVLHSTESLDFDAWARQLVDYVLEREGVTTKVQPSATSTTGRATSAA